MMTEEGLSKKKGKNVGALSFRAKNGERGCLLLACVAALALTGSAKSQSHAGLDAAAKRAKSLFFDAAGKKTAPARLLAHLQDKRITESSGLAASLQTPGVLWTHNDSGDGPYLFAIDRQGRTLAHFKVPNATNVDWEDIAIGPGRNGKPALYIGDFGDNGNNRAEAILYRVPEPPVNASLTMQERETLRAERFAFRYPDGAHNAETLLVDPKSGEVCIVTKVQSGISGVYRFPSPLQEGPHSILERVGTLTFRAQFLPGRLALAETLATGGNVSPNGRQIVIRTYFAGYSWNVPPGKTLAEALRVAPRRFSLPLMPQGESVCFGIDGHTLLLTSEGHSSPLWEVPNPQ